MAPADRKVLSRAEAPTTPKMMVLDMDKKNIFFLSSGSTPVVPRAEKAKNDVTMIANIHLFVVTTLYSNVQLALSIAFLIYTSLLRFCIKKYKFINN